MTTYYFPQRISIEITNNCNYLCAMCPQGKLVRKKGFISPGFYKKIIDECVKYNPMVWNHFIGEPLLHKDFFELLEYAVKKGIRSGFSTNGSFLDGSVIMKILKSSIERIELSLDALKKETYNDVRGMKNFNEIEKNVNQLLKTKYDMGLEKPLVSIQFVKQHKNIHELEEFTRKWSKILKGKDFVKSIDFITWAGTKTNNNNAELKLPSQRVPCGRIWKSLVVLWNGEVTPCTSDYNGELVIGNIKDDSIKNIWRNERLRKLRSSHDFNSFEKYPLCANCNEWILENDTDKYKNISIKKLEGHLQ